MEESKGVMYDENVKEGPAIQSNEEEKQSSEEEKDSKSVLSVKRAPPTNVLKTPTTIKYGSLPSPSLLNFKSGVGFTSTPLNRNSPAVKYLQKLKQTKNLVTITEENDDNHDVDNTMIHDIAETSNVREVPEIKTLLSNDFSEIEKKDVSVHEVSAEKVNAMNCDDLNATVIYHHADDKNMDDEEIEATKIDEYSIFFEKNEIELTLKEEVSLPTVVPTAHIDALPQKAQSEEVPVINKEELKPLKDIQIEIKHPVNKLQMFKSNDEKENRDNDNPKWEYLKNIKTDEERYDVVQSRWNNITVPNPKVNLSSFNWRKKNGFSSVIAPKRKRDTFKTRKILICLGNGTCTSIFERALGNAKDLFSLKYELTERKLEEEMRLLGWKQTLEIQTFRCPLSVLDDKHMQEVKSLTLRYQKQFEELTLAYNERVSNLNNAIKETERVYEFYERLQNIKSSHIFPNPKNLEKEELQQWVDIDHMIDVYNEYYH